MAKRKAKAKRNATTKQTAGLGYQFENEAVAYVLVHLLARTSPFGRPGGRVERVDTQRPTTEWRLDDILVTVRAHGSQHRLAFSSKSNRQITDKGFPEDFVRDAWEQILVPTAARFAEDRDFLGLMTSPLGPELAGAVETLLREARDRDPADLAYQTHLPDRSNDTVRALLDSARCPPDLATAHGVDREGSAGRLLRRLLWFPLDLQSQSSERRATALRLCRAALVSGSTDEADALWGRLKEVADRLRGGGGGTDLQALVRDVHGRFDLQGFPDHVADWERIDEDTNAALGRVKSTIGGGGVSVPRTREGAAVSNAFEASRSVVLLGASGIGKSGFAKAQAVAALSAGRALWLDAARLEARSLTEWRVHLGLSNLFSKVIGLASVSDALLVLDGLDRVHARDVFDTAAEFVRSAGVGGDGSPWRLLVTCTPEAWGRVRTELASRGVNIAPGSTIGFDLPADDELEAVWGAFPELEALRWRRHLAPVLLRPKILDLLASNRDAVGDAGLIGESDVARLFWDREVAPDGPRSAARADVALRLAGHLAESLRSGVPASTLVSDLGLTDTSALDDLIADRVVSQAEGEVAFDHDLYADWVRVRQLRDVDDRGELARFIGPRLRSPIWHRSFRLFGVDLLEQSRGTTAWDRAFEALGALPHPDREVAQDILLEATAFATAGGSGILREGLWGRLAADDGRLLVRLLERLAIAATFPDDRLVASVSETDPDLAVRVAATRRVPYAPYWYGILALLSTHSDEIPSRARREAARAVTLWLRSTLPGWPLRREAAGVAVAIGDDVLREKEATDDLFYPGEFYEDVNRAVLASGHEEPARVTQILLEASGRLDQRFVQPPLSDAEAEKVLRELQRHFPGVHRRPERLFPPWPHGPAFRADESLREVILESDALLPLAQALPEVAREVLLAALIRAPERSSVFDDDRFDRLALASKNWVPEFYTRGPFLGFLQTAEQQAVEAVLQLVDHATDRWAGVGPENGVYDPLIHSDVPTVTLEVGGAPKAFVGTADVFAWGWYGVPHDHVVPSALAALEKHLYDRADAGDDLTGLLTRLLEESRSLAVVGLLSLFVRRHPSYALGPLTELITSPDLLVWTQHGSAAVMWDSALHMGGLLSPGYIQALYVAWHKMPHRRRSLAGVALQIMPEDPALGARVADVAAQLRAETQPGGRYAGNATVAALATDLDGKVDQPLSDDVGREGTPFIPDGDPAPVESVEARLAVMGTPIECWQLLLYPGKPPEPEVLGRLWGQVTAIKEVAPDEADIATPLDALAGIATVILVYGADAPEFSERLKWAREVLLEAALGDLGTERDGSAAPWRAPAFAAIGLPALWAANPGDPQVREAVARIAVQGPRELVGALNARARPLRRELGEDHLRLVRAVMLRAEVAPRLHTATTAARYGPENVMAEARRQVEEIRKELYGVERALADGSLLAVVPSLDEIAPPLQKPRSGRSRAGRREAPSREIDDSFAEAALRGIPDPESPGDVWFDVWVQAVRGVCASLAPPGGGRAADLEGRPSSLEKHVLRRAAGLSTVPGLATGAHQLWGPIIALGAAASEWVLVFTDAWAEYALCEDAEQEVVSSWAEMIGAALASPAWESGEGYTIRTHTSGRLWRSLLGLDRFGPDVWSGALAGRVSDLAPLFERWARQRLDNSDNVRFFANALTFPAFASIRLDGMTWLAAAADADERFWGRPDRELPDAAVTDLLVHVWHDSKDDLGRRRAALDAFGALLQRLVGRRHPAALELASRVGAAPL